MKEKQISALGYEVARKSIALDGQERNERMIALLGEKGFTKREAIRLLRRDGLWEAK